MAGPLRGVRAPTFGLAEQTAGRRKASRLACVIGWAKARRPCRGAPVCAPVDESSMCAAGRHIGRPLQGVTEWFCFLVGLRLLVACSGRGMPRPYKNERSVTWRSDLFIDLTFTHIYTPTPGPGPQARCGKGVWSPEDQGDRCRVPRSFGPSGAGREQVKLLRRNQLDDHPTKGPRRCGGYTSSVGCADTFPSKGKATGVRYTSSGPSGHLPL